jgi:glycosyltransferase involved in cell wall biosynthesis
MAQTTDSTETEEEASMSSFYYLIPEQTKGRLDGESHIQYWKRRMFRGKEQLPIGGAKIIYQHCDILNRNGFKAIPLHLGDFTISWFPHETKAMYRPEALQLMQPDDVLICPEVIPAVAAEFPCKNRVAFIQNWALAEFGTGPDRSYEDFGFTSLLTCSRYLQEYMKNRSSLPGQVVINGIDLKTFFPPEKQKAENKVVILNRRNIADARNAIDLLDDKVRNTAEFVILENQYSQQEIAEFFRDADIFMAIGYPEGFALPPLEAMACGCAVIGFTGGGGLEHMIDGQTALVAEDGNVKQLSHCLQQVLTDIELKEKLRENGLAKAQEFSLENMERQLLEFARHITR